MTRIGSPTAVPQAMLMVILSAVGFGLNPLLARWADQDGLSAGITLLYRFGFSGMFLLPFLPPAANFPVPAGIALALGILMGMGIFIYFKALVLLPVALAVLIFFTYPLFTLLFGVLLYQERLSPISGVSAGLILLSCVLITSWQELSSEQVHLMLLSFLAPIAIALMILGLVHHLTPMPLLTRAAMVTFGQLIVLIPCSVLTISGPLTPSSLQGWLSVLALGTINSIIPQILMTAAAPLVGAAATAIGGSSELLTSLAIGWWVFREPLRWQEGLAAVLILMALALTVWESQQRARQQAAAAQVLSPEIG